MAQIVWIFLDTNGGRHRVGLYHGDRTGHVLIHCGGRITQVDFSVKESRTYSFFIEDELVEVQLVKDHGAFSYAFEINKTVDTPRNRIRRIDDRRDLKYMLFLIGGFVLVISLVFIGLKWRHPSAPQGVQLPETSAAGSIKGTLQLQLDAGGSLANAQLFIIREAGERKVYYGFHTQDSVRITGIFMVPDTGAILLPNGFALTDRDVFEVRYLPNEPYRHQVNFYHPSVATIFGYMQQGTEAEQKAHPQQSARQTICKTKTIVRERGWQALNEVIFQNDSPEKKPHHNRESYLRLINDPALAQILDAECPGK